MIRRPPRSTLFPYTSSSDLTDFDYLNYIQEHDKSRARWQRLSSDRPPTMVFWYRQSPQEIASSDFLNFAGNVTLWEPPSDTTGMISVCLDSRDRKSTRLNSSHGYISYAVFCLK